MLKLWVNYYILYGLHTYTILLTLLPTIYPAGPHRDRMPTLPYRSHTVLHHPGDTLLGTQQSDPETRDGDPVEGPGVQQCDRSDH